MSGEPPTRDLASRVLVAVFPHPDDESLFAGGLLADAARRGAQVRLLALTHGEAGGSGPDHDPAALASRRSRELETAARTLGACAPELWSWPDGGLAEQLATLPETHARLTAWLEAANPDAIVTFGPDGAYGHADHVASHAYVQTATQQLSRDTRVLTTAFDPGALRSVRKRLGRFLPRSLLPVEPDALGTPVAEGQLRVPLDDTLRRLKRQAVAAHVSQLPAGDVDQVLGPGILASLCHEERYEVRHGPPLSRTCADPFAELP